jgi:hypothetical protein
MAGVRSADMNKTPDIRTRAIVFPWAAVVKVSYVVPLITPTAVVNLAYAAGLTVGVGDWRPEKGKGTYGQFELVDEDDPRLPAVFAHGRASQLAALRDPEPYDEESAELLAWWQGDTRRRGLAPLLLGAGARRSPRDRQGAAAGGAGGRPLDLSEARAG